MIDPGEKKHTLPEQILFNFLPLYYPLIMSQPLTYRHTIYKIHVKFQNDWNKIVGGVALTEYQLFASKLTKYDYVHQLKLVKMKTMSNHLHSFRPCTKNL